LRFLLWEFDLAKLKAYKHQSKNGGEYINDVTLFNIEHFKVVFMTYLYQHLIFAIHYKLDYERYKNLFEDTIYEFRCVFCMFNDYLEFLLFDIKTISKRSL
jgi:hypothetical protein